MLNRTVVAAKAEDIKKEIKLENFSKNAILQEMNKAAVEQDKRYFKDNVPDDVKAAFNLPKDMSGLEIDFQEVRKVDASFKRRQP